MAHITRKELKKDEFAAEVSKTYEFLQRQRENVTRYGVAIGAAILVVLGAYFLLEYRRSGADEALSHAMRAYHAPLADQASPSSDAEFKFNDAKARYTQAEKEFDEIAGKYSWLRQGRAARYFAALSRKQLGKTDQAISELQRLASAGDDSLAGLAKYALAQTYAEQRRAAEAEKLLRELADKPQEPVTREIALLALAASLETAKPAEARKIYGDLRKSSIKSASLEADRRLQEMKSN